MREVALVALGGALGASSRYLTNLLFQKWLPFSSPPFSTLFVNIAGCFILGLVTVNFLKSGALDSRLALFALTGVLGGFTTFSAFGIESLSLIERGEFFWAAFYIGLSVLGGISAVFLGLWIGRA